MDEWNTDTESKTNKLRPYILRYIVQAHGDSKSIFYVRINEGIENEKDDSVGALIVEISYKFLINKGERFYLQCTWSKVCSTQVIYSANMSGKSFSFTLVNNFFCSFHSISVI